MSCVWKSPKSKYWIAQFADVNGKRHNRSTKTTDRKKAEKIAEQYEAAARGKRTVQQVRQVLADLLKEVSGETLEIVTARQQVERFLAEKKAEIAEGTFGIYQTALRNWLEVLGKKADSELERITRDDIIRHRAWLTEKLNPATANHRLAIVRMLFSTAKRQGLISTDPTETVEQVRVSEEKTRRPFTLEEIRVVLKHADKEWQSMIRFGLYTGQRLSDIALLTWGNIDTGKNVIRMSAKKTGKRMTLPINPALARHIATLQSSDDPSTPVHPKAHGIVTRKKTAALLSNQFADILAAAGFRASPRGRGEKGVTAKSGLSFHSLRHTASTLLREAGVAPALARAFVGHDSAEMHEHYAQVGEDALKRVANAIPEI